MISLTYAPLSTLLYCCVLSVSNNDDDDDEFGFEAAKNCISNITACYSKCLHPALCVVYIQYRCITCVLYIISATLIEFIA